MARGNALPNELIIDGDRFTDFQTIATKFNKYFTSISLILDATDSNSNDSMLLNFEIFNKYFTSISLILDATDSNSNDSMLLNFEIL